MVRKRRLPVRKDSESKGVQREHIRIMRTRQGIRPIKVNKGIRKAMPGERIKVSSVTPQIVRVEKRPYVRIRPRILDKPQVPKEFFEGIDSTATKNAIFWYFADAAKHFKNFDFKAKKRIANEISAITGTMPTFLPDSQYTPTDVKRSVDMIDKDMGLKYVGYGGGNRYKIKGVDATFTPLHLTAMLYYLVDDLTGGQLVDKSGYEYLKSAKVLSDALVHPWQEGLSWSDSELEAISKGMQPEAYVNTFPGMKEVPVHHRVGARAELEKRKKRFREVKLIDKGWLAEKGLREYVLFRDIDGKFVVGVTDTADFFIKDIGREFDDLAAAKRYVERVKRGEVK